MDRSCVWESRDLHVPVQDPRRSSFRSSYIAPIRGFPAWLRTNQQFLDEGLDAFSRTQTVRPGAPYPRNKSPRARQQVLLLSAIKRVVFSLASLRVDRSLSLKRCDVEFLRSVLARVLNRVELRMDVEASSAATYPSGKVIVRGTCRVSNAELDRRWEV
jgi:hypothetical protein